MPEPDLFLLFVRPLNQAGIRHVVSGSGLTTADFILSGVGFWGKTI